MSDDLMHCGGCGAFLEGVDDLVARIAELEAERDAAIGQARGQMLDHAQKTKKLNARIAALERELIQLAQAPPDPLLARLEELEEELRLAGLRIQLAKDAYKADKSKANWQAVGQAGNDASALRRVIGMLRGKEGKP